MIEARRLLTFREVAHRRSFSRAAEALFLTQPAVSQQIRALEVQLGERLIERRRGVFELTPPGRMLLEHADAIHERLELAETQLADAAGAGQRELRVGSFPSALSALVVPAAERIGASRDLEVTVVQGSSDDLVAELRRGAIHVALCYEDVSAPRTAPDGTRRIELLEEPMLAALGPRHPLAGRKRLRLAELASDPWLAAMRDGLIVRACRAAGFEPRLAYLTDDPLAINSLVTAGMAVTLAPKLLAGRLHGVATPTLTGEPVRRSLYALTPSTGPHLLVEPFLDAVRSVA
jgi:DNA-binding transcriptional LysR family regulator